MIHNVWESFQNSNSQFGATKLSPNIPLFICTLFLTVISCIEMKMVLQKWIYLIYVSTTSSSEAKTNFWITQDAIKGRNRREHQCDSGHT